MLVEKYRPKKLSNIIGQQHVTKTLSDIIKKGDIPHFLFVGPAGCGKTSTAYAFAYELGWDIVELNASDERGIDVVRSKIKTLSKLAGNRIILLDEADSLTEDAQHALRRIIERSAKNVRFILTANYEWKIIDPIKSRCAIYYFNRLSDEDILRIILTVLNNEGVKIEINKEIKNALITLIQYVDGDARKALNLVETLITENKSITIDNIKLLIPPQIALDVMNYALKGNFKKSFKLLEDLYISSKLNNDLLVEQFFKSIEKLSVEDSVKYRLYERLADIERNIKMGCNPLIQFTGFISTIMIVGKEVMR